MPVALGGELKYSREQTRWVEESIQIRRAAEPVELIEVVWLFYRALVSGIQFVQVFH